uniref:Uncharacterized protein n=1 Tax=Myotis myotis TaxID=51298 RepID=A0A7J7RKN2_MYOMY|nr:hypothetical protein mMyoMyo1_010300 [Myotis myotis]
MSLMLTPSTYIKTLGVASRPEAQPTRRKSVLQGSSWKRLRPPRAVSREARGKSPPSEGQERPAAVSPGSLRRRPQRGRTLGLAQHGAWPAFKPDPDSREEAAPFLTESTGGQLAVRGLPARNPIHLHICINFFLFLFVVVVVFTPSNLCNKHGCFFFFV